MRRPFDLALCATAVALVALPAPAALAQREIAPPGNAGVDEYLETVPNGRGNSRVDPNARPSGGAVSAATRRRLEALGKDGRAAAALADAGSDGAAGGPETGGVTGRAPGVDLDRAGDGRGGLATVVAESVGGGEGMGAALPTLMLLTLLAAGAYAIRRRRGPARP